MKERERLSQCLSNREDPISAPSHGGGTGSWVRESERVRERERVRE